MTNLQAADLATVRQLCEHWHEMSREEFHLCFAPAAVYVNMPRPDKRRIGPDAAFEALAPWGKRCKIELEILNIQCAGNVVMAERREWFRSRSGGTDIELYVVGVFEMENGKIAQWRDYYESAQAPSAPVST